jgi:hypothetical protein
LAFYRSRTPPAVTPKDNPPPAAELPLSKSPASDASADVADSGNVSKPKPVKLPQREPSLPISQVEDDKESSPVDPEETEVLDESVDEVETAPPVRLTGNAKAELAVEPANEETDAPASDIPEGLPKLVLQGTSVVDGKPIAVVNYQRLFEGDTIEGATVIRITDRSVQLEFEGKTFTLTF